MNHIPFPIRIRSFPDPDACWLWPGYLAHDGYAHIRYRGKPGWLAHRAAYTELVGPIPVGLEIDHLCGVRHCMNPAHLEAVDRKTNILRSNGPSAICARKTHCKRGHPFSPENTYTGKKGGPAKRCCRACTNESQRRYQARKRAAA